MLRPSKFLFIGLILGSCVPDGFVFEGLNTTYPALEYPVDNPENPAAAILGERLFFDPILSLDSGMSCGSCHKPELGCAHACDQNPARLDRNRGQRSGSEDRFHQASR